MNKSRSELLSLWTARINEVEENGYEIRRYCHDHNLKEKRYYFWRKKIRELENTTEEFTRLTFPSSQSNKGSSIGFSVLFKNGISIIPEEHFSEVEFLRAVKLLHRLQSC